jgi:hypothetical protein
MAEPQMRQMIFSVPEGGAVVIAYPEPLSVETVDMLEEFYALMIRGLRRRATHSEEKASGEAEYASWLTILVAAPSAGKPAPSEKESGNG